jgi:RNA-directed DNA polymerase
MASLPEMVKPDTGREATSIRSGRVPRGESGRRMSKDQFRNLGDPTGCSYRMGMRTDNRKPEYITVSGPCRESEGVTVALKRGNFRGAKDPCRKRVLARDEEIRLNESSTTEDAAREPDQPPDSPEVKSGVTLPPKVSELRRKLGHKAKQEPRYRFYAVYDRIYRIDVLTAAWWLVLKNDGVPGVDGMSCQDIINGPGAGVFLQKLQEELRTKSYQPLPVKRVYIPKPDGRQRPLGIPTVKDRIVQMATLLVLEPIFEADFLDSSYGFRPGKNAHQAIDTIRKHLNSGLQEVYDADLKGYFDTIPHDQLLKAVGMRISDRSVLRLLRMWLESPVVETDDHGHTKATRPKQGTPQGGVISPLLANVYLHWFEVLFHKPNGPAAWAKARIVRYADDFVVMARYMTRRLTDWIEGTLTDRFKLTINQEKTDVVRVRHPGTSLTFLGFTLRYDRDLFGRGTRYLNVCPSDKALARARDKIRELTSPQRCFMPLPQLISEINRWTRSWSNYFRYGYPRQAFRDLNRFIQERLALHLRRRSQRSYRPPADKSLYAHLQDLGLEFL